MFSKEVIKNDLKKDTDIICYVSDRNGRKSTAVQLFMLDEALNNKPFILIRSKIDEKIGLSWFSDYTLQIFQEKNIKPSLKKINNYIVEIRIEKDGKSHLYCYGLYLSVAEKYKSNFYKGFEKIEYLVWEECIPNKRQVQNIQYCQEHYFDELERVLSIGSTVARGRRLQYLFLGNDIAYNVVNSVTVGFDLLERIEKDCEIVDNCYINDKRYSFLFNYFSVPGGVNHWLVDLKKDINGDIDLKNTKKFDLILVTKYKRYYVYLRDKYIYITSKKNFRDAKIFTEKEFFKKYHAENLLTMEKQTALLFLCTFYNCPNYEIEQYYGKKWLSEHPIFKIQKENSPSNILNVDEISQMSYSQLFEMPNYETLLEFQQIIGRNHIIYENIGLKFKIEQILLTLKIG